MVKILNHLKIRRVNIHNILYWAS